MTESVGLKFHQAFEALTGHSPLYWQIRLFDRMIAGKIPKVIDLPTGLGKTSVIAIWLIALCKQAEEQRIRLPRRLIYIVNRRTVVDQATAMVEQIRERLQNPDCPEWSDHAETLRTLGTALQRLSRGKSDFLAVSTLRGELADNEEWKTDPARAAIIVGTIDLIGSKLLFSGYGDGRYKRPHHAGLVGQDSLIVHDEAHLTPAFSALLESVWDIQRADGESRPIEVMELSATQRDGYGGSDVLRLEEDDEQDRIVAERFDAKKTIRLHQAQKSKLNSRIAELAQEHDSSRAKALVYVRSPEDAVKIANDLKKRIKDKAGNRVALLTGTIRGYERDQLVENNSVYQQMLDPKARPPETVYMISTSAGEVGIDIDADHIVCDLAPLDSMIQRLGRVNRRGGKGREAQVDVVWTEEQANPGERASEFNKAISKTLEALQRWKEDANGSLNASSRNVRGLIDSLSREDRKGAFSPEPDIRHLTDILLDAWSLTSVDDMQGRPEVAAYLHGDTDDLPETYIAWRKEVSLFNEVADNVIRDWFHICPVWSNEKVGGQTERVKAFLRRLLNEHRKKGESNDVQVVMLHNRGKVERISLSEILASGDRQLLNHKTLVLPTEVGGLSEQGTLESRSVNPVENIDVADQDNGERKRKRIFPADSCPPGWKERGGIILRDAGEGAEEDEPEMRLKLVMPGRDVAVDDHEQARFDMTLREHTTAIVSNVADIGERIGLNGELASALAVACEWHDRGKNRDIWQRYAGKDGEPYAKSENYGHWRELGGYRHELGSLLDAMGDKSVKSHPERDLILHLIASHHGRGRPHFNSNAFDNERYGTRANAEAISETMRRFGQLQKRYGRWGLAWLEALMRCADIAASQPPGGFEEPQVEEEPCKYDTQVALL